MSERFVSLEKTNVDEFRKRRDADDYIGSIVSTIEHGDGIIEDLAVDSFDGSIAGVIVKVSTGYICFSLNQLKSEKLN